MEDTSVNIQAKPFSSVGDYPIDHENAGNLPNGHLLHSEQKNRPEAKRSC